MHRVHVVAISAAVLALALILSQSAPLPPPGGTTDLVLLQRAATLGRFGQPAASEGPVPVIAEEVFSQKKCVAEFLAMTIFVFLGCGSAMSIAKEEGSAWVLQVSLTFGLAITVLAYTIGHYSGGQINCAVTIALVFLGKVTVVQGLGNVVAQLLGSVVGSLILWLMYGGSPNAPTGSKSRDKTGGLGSNQVGEGWTWAGALLGEMAGTFVLVYVVLETAVNPANAANIAMAPVAIGLAVFLAHSVLIPVDGCSINPTRSFGPALVNLVDNNVAFSQLWIFWLGPLFGAAGAAGVYSIMGKA